MTFDGGPILRPGRRNNRNLYEQIGPEPDHSVDPSIGWARDSQALAQAIEAVNTGQRIPNSPWWCSGRLIYPGPGASLTADWVIAADTPEVARRIVAAVRGEANQ